MKTDTKPEESKRFRHGAHTGNHAHPHAAMGTQGDDTTHEHAHDHSADATHDHHKGAASVSIHVNGHTTTSTTNTTAPVVVTAAADDGSEWHAYLTVEGLRTTDHRAIAADALTWRDLPLPLLWCEDGNGHSDSTIVGSITSIERQDGGKIYASGTFDMGGEAGTEAARLCTEQMLRWVSVDLEVLSSELITIGSGGSSGDPFLDELFGPMPGDDDDWYEEVTEGRIMGAHMVAFPAFPQAVIAPASQALADVEPMGEAPKVVPGLIACGAAGEPPAAWFANPGLSGPTPVTVLADGRVYGHLATWGTCHTGFEGACVCAPKSGHGYAYAMTGRVRTAEGNFQPVGQITMGTGHADLRAGHRAAAEHYDHTGSAVADVAFGEDDHGIWFAGALRPGLTDDQVRILRASALSGDWRQIGGGLELVAALAVNVPGFPIVAASPRAGIAYDEAAPTQVSLVAAALVRRDPLGPVRVELAAVRGEVGVLRRVVDSLLPLARQAIGDRLGV